MTLGQSKELQILIGKALVVLLEGLSGHPYDNTYIELKELLEEIEG